MTHNTGIGLPAATAGVPRAALAVAGGGSDGSTATAPPANANGRPATVGLANERKLATILVDSHGRTLYLFQKDSATKSRELE